MHDRASDCTIDINSCHVMSRICVLTQTPSGGPQLTPLEDKCIRIMLIAGQPGPYWEWSKS